jgi:predicted ATPase/serine/threonine protein kinase/class 3 adenylate cyclase/Tfp pilus assembly protein PilF
MKIERAEQPQDKDNELKVVPGEGELSGIATTPIPARITPPPSGLLTVVFTDIEGSTQLWEHHPHIMKLALARHDSLVREALETNGGYVYKLIGDAFQAVFTEPIKALQACQQAQQALFSENWATEIGTLKVRMALHTCQVEARDGDYVSPNLNRLARLLAVAHGGQVLLSLATTEQVQDHLPSELSLQDMGEHRLKDLIRPEHIFQLCVPGLPDNFPPLKSLDNLPNNLPIQLTSFVGREKELAELKRLLSPDAARGRPTFRLLTLVGPGGTGKTRLAVQVAAEVMQHYRDGVWLIELAALGLESQIVPALAQTLNLPEKPGKPILTSLIEHLKGQQVLLILDNCEHLIDSCARTANTLLTACPNLQILATSREALNINGETTFRVPSLTLPGSTGKPLSPDKLSDYEAVKLFIDRATAVNPGWTITNQNAPALVQLCNRLDGIPLALELAAARIKSLTVEQINARLDDRFKLLTGGSRTAVPRQQTLRALVDWSYELLTESEKLLLQRLTVFGGSWSLEAAEQICAGEGLEDFEILDNLEQLVNKSLVVLEDSQGKEARYRFLETIRQYTRPKLVASGEESWLLPRYLEYFLALCEEAASKLSGGGEQANWLARLQTEYDNIRAALDGAIQGRIELETGLKLALAFWRFWEIRSYFSEGVDYFARLLEKARLDGAEDAPLYPWGLMRLGVLEWRRGNFAVAQTSYEEALEWMQRLGDTTGTGATLNNLGNLFLSQGKIAEARPVMEQSLALARQTEDWPRVAITLGNLGAIASNQQDYASAEQYFQESLKLTRKLDYLQQTANNLNNLGYLALVRGDYATAQPYELESLAAFRKLQNLGATCAVLNNLGWITQHNEEYHQSREYYLESLEISQQIGHKKETANSLVGLGVLAVHQKHLRRAARLFGGVRAFLDTANLKLNELEQKEHEQAFDSMLIDLEQAEFKFEWETGQLMSLEDLCRYAGEVEPEPEIELALEPELPPTEIFETSGGPLKAGLLLGGTYRLEKRLGKGAMGEVWLARHMLLDQLRAIKIVLQSLGDNEEVVNRFIHGEARSALRLEHHPHIVRVYELGMQGQMPYIVMEFVQGDERGATLRDLMQTKEKFSPAEVADILDQLASALDAAHRLNLIHRDVKPANIMLDGQMPGLHLKLSDFGLAKDLEADVELTQSQQVLGTPLYMAPEQLNGQAEARSDQYSLGVIVYQLLCGRPPFTGSTNHLLIQHLSSPPPPIQDVLPALPVSISAVVIRALAKRPQERYNNAGEFAAAFRQAVRTWDSGQTQSKPSQSSPASIGQDDATQSLEVEKETQVLPPSTLGLNPEPES